MRVVVTGGTGFIGSSVVRLLRAAKHEVRLLVRTGSQTDHLGAHDLELVEGDILEPGSLTSTFQGFDCVVHIAGSLGRDPRSRRETWRVNVDGTVNVMNAALAARVPKVVYTSSVVAVGSTLRGTEMLDETCHWAAGKNVSTYVRSKYTAQREARSIARRGIEFVSLNPAFTLGPGGDSSGSVGQLLSVFMGKLPGVLRGGVGVVDVREVALAHLKAVESTLGVDRVILSAENHTLERLFAIASAIGGVVPPKVLPYALILGLARATEAMAKLKPSLAERFNLELVDDAHRYWFVNNTLSRELLGMQYRSVRETVADTIRSALHDGRLEATTPELEVLKEDAPIDLDLEMKRLAIQHSTNL